MIITLCCVRARVITKIGHISIQTNAHIHFYWYKMKYWELRDVKLNNHVFLKKMLQKNLL